MRYPTLYTKQSERQMVDVFKGYNHNLRISDGEFFDMKNLTSDYYPVLSPRKRRGVYATPASVQGLIAKDSLCYVDGTNFIINEYSVDMGLSDEPKQLISMGAYVIILPDKKYINTQNLEDWGSMEAEAVTYGEVSFSLCRADGSEITDVETEEPADPQNGTMWLDTSVSPPVLKQYSTSSSLMWVQVDSTYVKISAEGIGVGFSKHDGVTISGVTVQTPTALNGSFTLHAVELGYIVVTGILAEAVTQADAVTVKRTVPKMDFVTECGNRLWGCRYGLSEEGQVVNEIYCCKLGDFKNWSCYMGIATDSWRASIGTDGQFTGAVTHLGYPIFFKENCMHKVYPSQYGAHSIQDTACRGVQKGCEKSLAIVNEVLYYKARSGVCAYDGSLPVEISAVFGDVRYDNAVAGAHGNKYYISMQETVTQGYHLFVYDTAKGLWHREDSLHAEDFCSCRGELYAISEGSIITMLGSGTQDTEPVKWMAQTGEIGVSYPDMKYISRLTIRMSMAPGAQVRIYGQYDFCDEWELLFVLESASFRSFSVPVRPKRCDFMRLRFEGDGVAKIYAITKTIEQGSELS